MKTVLCIATALIACVISTYADASSTRQLFRYETKQDFTAMFYSGAKWDSLANGIIFREQGAPDDKNGIPMGRIESGDLEPGFGFDEVVLSWNADTPRGSYLKIYVQVRSGECWSRQFCYAIWNRDNVPMKRMSVRGQRDHIASLRADILYLRRPGDAVRVSARLCSADGTVYPTLKALTVHVMDTKGRLPRANSKKDVWGKDLDVPQLSQLSVPDGGRFCSATSTAMALCYWAQELGRPDLTCGVQQAVDGIYDIGWGGTGNWTFNTAFAGEFEGIRAVVTRFDSLNDIEKWISAGVPVIVSLDYNKLRARDTAQRSGHLMLVRGFTAAGEVILNDPATRLDLGRSGRVVYSREALEASWLRNPGSWGTVYLIYPEGWKAPRNKW